MSLGKFFDAIGRELKKVGGCIATGLKHGAKFAIEYLELVGSVSGLVSGNPVVGATVAGVLNKEHQFIGKQSVNC